MENNINGIPGGLLTLSKDFEIEEINHTLLQLLRYDIDELIGQSVRTILTRSTQAFFQFIFYPLLIQKQQVEEVSLELMSHQGEKIPVLLYASTRLDGIISCIIVPNKKRNQYENELLEANKLAEERLKEKDRINAELQLVLHNLEEKQAEMLRINQQNLKYKTETQKELSLAKKIQETTLTDAINNEHLQIESYYHASNELSGDIYGFYQINEHQYGIILLDVMGHGISSSLITMSLVTLFQRLISKGASSDQIMKELDDQMHLLFENEEDAWHYCTAIYLSIDIKEQTVEYINAGHPPAIYLGLEGEHRELKTQGPPIGSFKGMDFKHSVFSYTKGARILLYTDGVSEPFEQGRLHSFLKKHSRASLSVAKEKLAKMLKDKENVGYRSDDQCYILIDLK
ncbi:PP2C family protein-serine/threonine phosphatase [Bacillus suaedae]|uniref:SpoIIE family protein phosphatase n=1 Tax=Halalkalibacter suaedae TaxID=2822140 RepID=A0A941ANH2_9BACI|nr:SpoIIE family protein phosphatase [Bacillus suaedae]MBP3951625.1 SpoIIE family protein phosphatase [Bacillus suaedae]